MQCKTLKKIIMKKLRILTIALLLAISFVGCKDDDKESNCDKEIQDIIDQYGQPTMQQTISTGDQNAIQYMYEDDGIAFTFYWGKGYKECEVVRQSWSFGDLDF